MYYIIVLYCVVYDEQFKFKHTKENERLEVRRKENKDSSHEFDIVVKAANPKKKLSTIVNSQL